MLHLPRKIKKEFNNPKFGRNNYERALSSLDSYLKRFLEEIDNECVILLHGDHGEKIYNTFVPEFVRKTRVIYYNLKNRIGFLNEEPFITVGHGYHVYDYFIKVPLIIYAKGLNPRRKKITDQVSQIDILPTLLDILDLYRFRDTYKNKVQGISLLPVIMGQKISCKHIFMEACGSVLGNKKNWKVGVRTNEFKYIYSPYRKEIIEELYDLKNDPKEEKNIVSNNRNIGSKYKKLIEKEYLSLNEEQKIRISVKKLKKLGKI